MTSNPTVTRKPQTDNFAHLKCSPTTLICREKTVILGDVTIGADCVIHPASVIIAKEGPIVIGNSNLIEERVKIVNDRRNTMNIGDHNVFEVNSQCQAPLVGNHNILEAKSRVGRNIELTNNCVIGAGCELTEEGPQGDEIERFPPYTVISGKELNRTIVPNLATNSLFPQLDFLRKVLPNYQKLWRPLVATHPTTQMK